MRVVLDTNVIVSGLLGPTGPPFRSLRAAEDGEFTWITSQQLIDEIGRVLNRPVIKRIVGSERIGAFTVAVQGVSEIVEPTITIEAARDPDDNRVLEAAVAGRADYIVTGDRDLLELGSHAGISIITPAAFAALLDASA